MRVKGRIENQWVTILIDSRSTYNFLDLVIFKKSNLPIDDMEKVKVTVTNGDLIPSKGKCSGLRVLIQEITLLLEAQGTICCWVLNDSGSLALFCGTLKSSP